MWMFKAEIAGNLNQLHWSKESVSLGIKPAPPRGTFLCPRGTFLCPGGHLFMPRGHLFMPRGYCLATQGHLFVPWGQLFVLFSKITNSMMIANLMN